MDRDLVHPNKGAIAVLPWIAPWGTRTTIWLLTVALACAAFAVGACLILREKEAMKPVIGSIRCEIWRNIEGSQITDTLADGDLAGPASETWRLNSFELKAASKAPGACALRGYVIAPESGEYHFFRFFRWKRS
jgi:hypothetical protein